MTAPRTSRLSPLEFMQRLAVLVPRPRLHLIRFHGVLAPNAKLRALVVQACPDEDVAASELAAAEPACEHRRSARISWARLLKRVFEIDLEHCPNCGGQLKIIAAILESAVIERILTHLGLQADCGRMTAPARGHASQEGLAPASASAARRPGRRCGLRRVSVRWRKPPDRGSTVPVPSSQHLGTMGRAATGAF